MSDCVNANQMEDMLDGTVYYLMPRIGLNMI